MTFDHYEVLTRDDGSPFELGRGAMGITYKAFDTSLRVPVALKVINGTYLDSETARQRFIREARSAAKLRHRHVASVFHLGTEGDTYFYAMEFIDGETVDALIKRQGPLSPSLALQLAAQVARALGAAQPHGLVHRDIKPANLMLVREDDELMVKVIDFGLAKSSLPGDGDEESAAVSVSGFVGTPHFASPEQLEEKEIDVRSDIYSLGVTLWYMLAGQTPFAGSMAHVMSQHLAQPPPLAQLRGLPAPVTALLARMLEKAPADRPQTPAELRREVEACLLVIGGEAADAAIPAESAASPAPPARFETGAIVADRYQIAADLGETNTGHLFHAHQLEPEREVRLLLLGPELIGDAAVFAQIEREVERVAAVRHSHLLEVCGLETLSGASFIVMEWTSGFSLLELLRTRRELTAGEVLALLPQAAEGMDHAMKAGLKRLDLALHQLFVHFPAPAPAKEELLRQPVTNWPPFSLKLNPLGITRELSASETWGGRQTMVGSDVGSRSSDGADQPPRHIQALAGVVYELLGGTLAPFALSSAGAPRYTPVATLSEDGNNVLRRALDPRTSFATAHDFYSALNGIDVLEVKHHETRAAGLASKTTARPGAATPPAALARPGVPVKFIGGLAAAAIVAAAVIFLAPEEAKEAAPIPAQPSETTPETNAEATRDAEPETLPPAPPEPTQAELLKAAIAEAGALDEDRELSQSIAAWLRIAQEFPEADSGRVRLEMIFERLRAEPDEVNARTFPAIRELAVEAARLDVLAAMALLGKSLSKSDPAASFDWYSAAAAKGDPNSLTQLGLLLSNRGGEANLAKAAASFAEASARGDIAATYLLGECYFRGNGVKRDYERAVGLLRAAADKGHVFAMDLLGACYHQGLGVEKDFNKARELFTVAHERGYAVATGNLGVLYVNGEGMPAPDPKKAVTLFEKGISAGDANCMFFYARCLEQGVGIRPNALKAQTWYLKAAQAGNRPAADWCRKNGVDVP